jgi:hypothetical protein
MEMPMYCRRDDYPFLPSDALGGLPCVAATPGERIDPRAEALRLESEVVPPAVRIGMNPRLGMVAVPTWFWVEGYDGGELARARTVVEAHQECRFVMVHDDRGSVVLAADGRPELERQCETRTTSFTVQVRLWPNHYIWDFGDRSNQEIVCASPRLCRDALGTVYTDPYHPSTVRHPYIWTSLGQTGVNDDEDAYRIALAITFSAAFRVGVNGASPGGWQTLPDRELSWAASHQVQEAQAVLTRPAPRP